MNIIKTKSLTFAILVLTSSFLSNSAFAQFIEIRASVHSSRDMHRHGSFSLIFDTRSAPIEYADDFLFFPAVTGTVFTNGSFAPGGVPFSVAHPRKAGYDKIEHVLPYDSTSGITVSSNGFISIKAFKNIDHDGYYFPLRTPSIKLFFEGEGAIPALATDITSLPDDPEDYKFILTEGTHISATINNGHSSATFSSDFETGGLYYTAGYVTDPAANPCSQADISEDGTLNAWDATLFSLAYLFQRPIADINNDGAVDLGDLSDFIHLFTQGCDEG